MPDRDGFMSRLASVLSGREGLKWATAVHVPVWPSHSRARSLSPTRPTTLLAALQTEPRLLVLEESVIAVGSRGLPAPRGQTLRRLSESGGPQAPIHQWGESSLEELEDFIDSYFETVWEQTVGSLHTPQSGHFTIEQGAAVDVPEEEEVLASIDRKLTKLELLEDIRKDVAKLRGSLEHSCQVKEELRGSCKQDASNTG